MGSSLGDIPAQHDYRLTAGIARIVLIATAILIGALVPWDSVLPWNSTSPAPAQVIHEDDPGWDCATMGNLTCGPPLKG